MSDWLLGQRYGFGAARVRLRPEPPCAQPTASLRLGLRIVASELRAQGWLRSARNGAALTPALALGLAHRSGLRGALSAGDCPLTGASPLKLGQPFHNLPLSPDSVVVDGLPFEPWFTGDDFLNTEIPFHAISGVQLPEPDEVVDVLPVSDQCAGPPASFDEAVR